MIKSAGFPKLRKVNNENTESTYSRKLFAGFWDYILFLVESYRADKGPRQRILLDLGKLTIPKEQWKLLANRIEEIINGQNALFEIEAEIETLA